LSPPIEGAYPLSPLQEGLLFHAVTAPGSGAYCNQTALLVDGGLDVAALRGAWQELIARHDALRTAFAWKRQKRPLQLVFASVDAPIRELDWSHDAGWRERATQFLDADQRAGFDLARPPLFRIQVIRLPESRHLLVMTHHHVLMDGWSSVRLRAELAELLVARAQARAPRLAAAPRLRDYAAWLGQRPSADAERFWRETLAGFASATPIASSSARRPEGDAGHAVQSRSLAAQDFARLQARARGAGLTLGTLAAGAWAIVLARCTGRSDVVFGLTVSGRPAELPGAEDMIGLFINSVPFRAHCRPDAAPGAWLEALQRARLAAEPFDSTPLSRIQACSELPASETLFDHLLIFENYARPDAAPVAGGGARAEPFRHHQPTHYAVTLYALPRESLDLELRHDPARVSSARAEQLLDAWLQVLRQLADPALACLGQVSLLEPEALERQRALGRSAPPALTRETLVERFAAVARAHAERTAVIDGNTRLTYAELEQRARACARLLQDAGVRPGDRVGLCLRRSAASTQAILGIWHAGAAYVPVDPDDPAERIAAILERAGAAHALSDAACSGALPAGVRALELPAAHAPVRALADVAHCAESPAYVMFTSGTTGQPKGIAVAQRSVLALADSGFAPAGPGQVVAHVANLCFDTSGFELWTALLHGATLCVIDRDTLLESAALRTRIERERIDVLQLTPALFNKHVDADPEIFARIGQLVVGGEASDPAHVRRALAAVHPPGALINAYGPTEAAIWATTARLASEPGNQPVSIGRPLPGWQAHVLDAELGALPSELAGGLYLGGVGLAHGYWSDPRQTAERFVPHPFPSTPGERLYDTGDRARWDTRGELRFLGRSDDQLKLRGHRIEPAEIETAARRCPGVGDAVALAYAAPGGDARIALYWTRTPGSDTTGDRLEHALAQQLPSYMLPAVCIQLDAFPVTSRGKLDRRALPRPEARDAGAQRVPPRDRVEQILADIWTELLELPEVGVHDDFFELGGHSLLAVQVIERARAQLGGEGALPLALLFEAPTIAGVAARLAQSSTARSSPLIALRRGGARPALFCFHPAGGHVAGYRALADKLAGQPVWGVQARALLDPAQRAGSLDALADDYAALLAEHAPSRPLRLLGWSLGGVTAMAVAARLERAGRRVDFIGLVDAPLAAPTPRGDAGSESLVERTARLLGASPEDGVVLALPADVRADFEARLAALPDDDARLAAALAYAHERGLLPRSVSLAVCRLRNATLEHAHGLLRGHALERVRSPLHVWLAGKGSPDPEAARAGWARWSATRPRVAVVPGVDHLEIITAPGLASAVASALQILGEGPDAQPGTRNEERIP